MQIKYFCWKFSIGIEISVNVKYMLDFEDWVWKQLIIFFIDCMLNDSILDILSQMIIKLISLISLYI